MIRSDHMKLVRSIAWSFHFTTGLPFEDLYGECCLQYWRAMKSRRRKSEAKETTYLYSFITKQVIFYTRDEDKKRNIKWELEFRRDEYQNTPQYEFFGNDFPRDVQAVVDLVIDPDFNLEEVAPKMARGILFNQLIDMGWTHKRAWDALRETRKIVKQTEIGCII